MNKDIKNFFPLKKVIGISIMLIFILNIVQLRAQEASDASLKLHYTFKKLSADKSQVMDESGNGYRAALSNGASLKKIGSLTVLDLGQKNGFLNLGAETGKLISTLENFSISVNLYIDPTTSVDINGNFVWTFANSDDMGAAQNGNMFFSAKSLRYAISKKHWEGETSLDVGSALTKGVWKNVTYTQTGNTGIIYVDGVVVKTGNLNLTPSALGATTHNYLGKPCYNGDAYLQKTLLTDFRIYNRPLTAKEVTTLTLNLAGLNEGLLKEQLIAAKEALQLNNVNHVISNIKLPADAGNKIAITWSSSNTAFITNQGIVTRPAIGKKPASVKLTATLKKGGNSLLKEFAVTILPTFTDKESVKKDASGIVFDNTINHLRSDLQLPEKGNEGSTITWKSSNTIFLSDAGKVLSHPKQGAGKARATLTATVAKGKEVITKNFEILVAEDEGFASYLFVYFTGNGPEEEAIRFALSSDGFNYRAVNNNKPILSSASISSAGGVRDPHILRGADGKTFFMVATDMQVAKYGWGANYAMVLFKSTDLINWESTIVNIPNTFPEFKDVNRVWAPQTIYDQEKKKYMLYWSMRFGNGADVIYYAYANPDFTGFETSPKPLFIPPNKGACIDGDIIYKDGKYNLFFKTEGSGAGIKRAISDKLTEGYILYDQYLQQTTLPVEGAGVFKLINTDTYILMYDMYTSGSYQFTKSKDLINFSVIDDEISMNFHPRHGTVLPITKAEAEAITRKWSTLDDLVIHSARSTSIKKHNVVIDNTNNTVYLPAKRGTNLNAFNPEFTSLPGAVITPNTPQDFTKDNPITYTVAVDGIGSKTYKVSATIDNNPALDGYYADPEVLYSHKTGKYYIYPTSDGFTGWSGYYFKTFSSPNLVDWKDEGVILNLPTDVSWASVNAWAPTIAEKKINGQYKYFYYFTAAQKIGVAVSDNPNGPFIDTGAPLIASRPAGVSGGQQIDPDVFTDPKTSKSYIYWGNGYLACAELNDNMISVNLNTIKIMTPDHTFREGTEVFYRNGLYYFLWSDDDTRSPEYKVRYATSTSPIGPLTIPANNLVIAKDPSMGIYGTGHNSVIQVPGKDEWYIVYHRFTRPNGINMGDAAGYNREVCIDKLEFNEDGSIKLVNPTLKGINPVVNDSSDK